MYAVKTVVVVVFALMGVTHSRAETMLALWFAVWKQEQRSLRENLGRGVGNWLSGEAGPLTFRSRLNWREMRRRERKRDQRETSKLEMWRGPTLALSAWLERGTREWLKKELWAKLQSQRDWGGERCSQANLSSNPALLSILRPLCLDLFTSDAAHLLRED